MNETLLAQSQNKREGITATRHPLFVNWWWDEQEGILDLGDFKLGFSQKDFHRIKQIADQHNTEMQRLWEWEATQDEGVK